MKIGMFVGLGCVLFLLSWIYFYVFCNVLGLSFFVCVCVESSLLLKLCCCEGLKLQEKT